MKTLKINWRDEALKPDITFPWNSDTFNPFFQLSSEASTKENFHFVLTSLAESFDTRTAIDNSRKLVWHALRSAHSFHWRQLNIDSAEINLSAGQWRWGSVNANETSIHPFMLHDGVAERAICIHTFTVFNKQNYYFCDRHLLAIRPNYSRRIWIWLHS